MALTLTHDFVWKLFGVLLPHPIISTGKMKIQIYHLYWTIMKIHCCIGYQLIVYITNFRLIAN